MELFEAIDKRASLKTHISTREVEDDVILKVLAAAALAPSARNLQPWRFIVVKGREAVENLVMKAFQEFNYEVREAPVVLVLCANPNDDIIRDGKPFYLLDGGMAAENMLLAATALGLVTHPMTGVEEEELKKILGIPPEVRFVIATPLAYPVESSYDEAVKKRLEHRSRKGLKEIAYSGVWGRPFVA